MKTLKMQMWLGVLLAVVSACGGGKSSAPTTPTAVGPTSVTVSGPTTVRNGTTVTYTASAACTWSTDAPSVIAVDPTTGAVTGRGIGDAHVICRASNGVQGALRVTVIADFQGTWSGSYSVEGCTQTGTFASVNMCSNFPYGRVFPVNLNLIQDTDRVQGTMYLGTLTGSVIGPVSGASVTLTGTVRSDATTIDTVWTLRSEVAGRITGTFTQLWRTAGVVGEMRVSLVVRDLNRSSTSAATSARPHEPTARSLEDMVRALEGR